MNRKEVKKLLPTLQAFADGKQIEGIYKGVKSPWFNVENMDLDGGTIYRIKPEPKYIPFANADECWNEMLKHQPFGWIIRHDANKSMITEVLKNGIVISLQISAYYGYKNAHRLFTFADGTPFGIKESEG